MPCNKRYSNIITYYICLCGGLCWDSLHLVIPEVIRPQLLRTISRMKEKGLITVSGNGKYKTIRPTLALLPCIQQIGEREYQFYLDSYSGKDILPYGNDSKRLSKIERQHRVSEALIFFHSQGICVWPWTKPSLSLTQSAQQPIVFDSPTFYSSKEVKAINPDFEKKIRFSRSVGVLFSDGGNYPVYNLGRAGMNWDSYGEIKLQIFMEQIIQTNGIKGKIGCKKSGIIMGYDTELIFNILKINEKTYRNLKWTKKTTSFEFFTTSSIYDSLFYIPFGDVGVFLIRLLTTNNWENKLYSILFGNNAQKYRTSRYNCSAYVNGKFYFDFIPFDITALRDFKEAFILKGTESFIILCLAEQKKYLIDFLGETANIKIIQKEKIAQALKGSNL